jgi:translation elongation factor EF-Tu-like GTPase
MDFTIQNIAGEIISSPKVVDANNPAEEVEQSVMQVMNEVSERVSEKKKNEIRPSTAKIEGIIEIKYRCTNSTRC